MKTKTHSSTSSYKYAIWGFVAALLAAGLALIPALIVSHGIFSFPDSGFLISLIAPLAGDFIGIVTLIFFVLTTGFSALAAYLYISQFAPNSIYTAISSVMYSFSGIALAFVGHTEWNCLLIFIPLLLWSTEKFFLQDKKAYLAPTAALCLLCSSSVSVGIPIIWIVYCIMRRKDFSVNISAKKILILIFEWLLAVALSSVLLLPELFNLTEISFSSLLTLITGGAFLNINSAAEMLSHLSQHIFPALTNVGHGAVFSPVWLPLIGLSCGAALIFSSKYHPLQGLLRLCTILLMLTCLFAGNSIHWWVIVPTLFFATAGAVVLSDKSKDNPEKTAFLWLMALTSVWVVLMGILFSINKITINPASLQGSIILAVASVLAGMIVVLYKPKEHIILGVTVVICAGVFGSAFYHGFIDYPEAFILKADQTTVVDNYFAGENDRLELPSDCEYLAKPWGRNSLSAPDGTGSLADFAAISTLGINNPYEIDNDNYALRNLLSCRWKLVPNGQAVNLVGYEYYGKLGSLDVYQNLYSLPFGIVYDAYIPAHILQLAPPEQKAQLALKGIAIRPEDLSKVSSILTPVAENELNNLNVYDTLNDCYFLSSRKVDSVRISNSGFTVQTNFDRERVVFFSVPYSSNANCLIDGEPAEILLANGGYMGIVIPEGQRTIVVDRYPLAGILGQWLSLGAAVIIVIYFIVMRSLDIKFAHKRKKDELLKTSSEPSPLDLLEPPPVIKITPAGEPHITQTLEPMLTLDTKGESEMETQNQGEAEAQAEAEAEAEAEAQAEAEAEAEGEVQAEAEAIAEMEAETQFEEESEEEIFSLSDLLTDADWEEITDNENNDNTDVDDDTDVTDEEDTISGEQLDFDEIRLTIEPPPEMTPIIKQPLLADTTIDESSSAEEIQEVLAAQKQKRDEQFKKLLSKRNKENNS